MISLLSFQIYWVGAHSSCGSFGGCGGESENIKIYLTGLGQRSAVLSLCPSLCLSLFEPVVSSLSAVDRS